MSTPIARTPSAALASIPDRMRFELLRWIIGRRITCPLTGQVLDLETAVVILDADGDPHLALSPDGWDGLAPAVRAEIATEDGSKVDDPRCPACRSRHQPHCDRVPGAPTAVS